MGSSDDQGKDRLQQAYNLTLASVAGQVGCLTLIVILAALFAGLWLDKTFNSKPIFTLVLMIISVPVTLVIMFRVVTAATKRIKPDQPGKLADQSVEEKNRD
jgi:F0F1-type ATP synthase assembly protein I